MIMLILCAFFPTIDCTCPFTKPWKFYTCYHEIPETPVVWLYVLVAILVFLSTCLGVKLYFVFNIGWLHPNEDLPRYPLMNALPLQQLQPPPQLLRAPSVVSYFQLTGGDD